MIARPGRIASLLLAGVLALLLAVPAGPGAARAEPAVAGAPADNAAPRRILVLLRLAPDHFRPGASYGGGYGNGLSRSAARRVARRIARDHALALVDDWPMPLLRLNCFVMTVPADRTPESVARQVETDPAVVWAQPMHDYETQGSDGGTGERAGTGAARGDPMLAAQPVARAWHLLDLHRLATGRGVTVAVIDTQVERTHPDLAGQIAGAQSFVSGHPVAAELHGTAVAGIIAARGDNGVGILGVAPRARLLALRACWQRPGNAGSACDSFSLAEALHYAILHHADVINLSLSGPPDRLLATLIALAQARGGTVVAAADRDRADGGFPASAPGVIAVSDAPFAASPTKIYVAPGRDVLTTEPGGRWYLVNGSSYAAAHVSGLVALLRERNNVALLREHGGGPVRLAGAGELIDACATLVPVSPTCDCRCAIGRALARH